MAVNYEVLSKDGASIGVSGSLEIPANGQRSMFLNEVPGAQALPAEFKGVIRVTTSGSISAMGIRGRTNAANFLSRQPCRIKVPMILPLNSTFLILRKVAATLPNSSCLEEVQLQKRILAPFSFIHSPARP